MGAAGTSNRHIQIRPMKRLKDQFPFLVCNIFQNEFFSIPTFIFCPYNFH